MGEKFKWLLLFLLMSVMSYTAEFEEEIEEVYQRNNISSFRILENRKFFDLGNMRFFFDKKITQAESEKSNEWKGALEYQGPLFYGELTTTYDPQSNEFTGAKLYYPDIYKKHFIQMTGNNVGKGRWERSFLYDKDRGYIEEGKKFIIRQNVPIGSRVELEYLGAIIDIQHEENGLVEFKNSEIRSNREYRLKIYTKDGEIEEITIKTSDNFNQQNRGEFQNRFFTKEDKSSGKELYEMGTYYGVTDYFTTGLLYFNSPERKKLELKGIYSNYYKQYPYTFILGAEKESYEGLFQIKFQDLKLRGEKGYYSREYSKKISETISAQWNPYSFLRTDVSYGRVKRYSGGEESGFNLYTEVSRKFQGILATFELKKDMNDSRIYGANFYYTGLENYSLRWKNSLNEEGENLESALALYSRGNDRVLDYQFEISYNGTEREKFSFKFQINYDNWLNIKFNGRDTKNYEARVGIDRVVDLKKTLGGK